MSSQDSKWKTITILILVAVTLIGASLYFNWRLMEMQGNFNKRVAANAANANAQIRSLVDENADLNEQILQLEQAILDLEAWVTETQNQQNTRINNLQNDVQRLTSRVDSNSQSISRIWSDIYDLQSRVEYLEWRDAGGNCTSCYEESCEVAGCKDCECGYGNCYDCWRWGGCACGCYGPYGPYGP